jgi:type II secretory pathway component PulC
VAKRLTKKNITILNLILFGLLLITLAAVAVPYLKSERIEPTSQGTREPASTGIAESEAPLSDARREEQLARVIDRDIFRDPRLVQEKPVVITPPPPLQWTLVGVTSINREPVAIIRDMKVRTPTGQQEHMVREGDEVEGYFGVRITSIGINPPSVTYNRPGVGDETLTMETTATGAPGSTRDQWAETIRAVREGHTYVVKLPELQIRVGSVEAYMGTFGSEPNMEGTRSSGLKITSLSNDNLLYMAGLRQGDIIKAINGSPITDQASVLAQLAEAAKGFNVQLQVERGRTSQTMFYTLLKQ